MSLGPAHVSWSVLAGEIQLFNYQEFRELLEIMLVA